MNRYAHIQNGAIFEIIEPFVRREEDRPPAPEKLPPEAELPAEEWAAREQQQAAHDAYAPGEVPIEERFVPEFVAALVLLPEGSPAEAGWSYDGAGFAPPPAAPEGPPPPRVVSRRQGRRALLAAGLLDKVQLVIDALPDKERAEAQIDWDDATEFDRDSEFVMRLAPALKLDEAKLDELFAAAAGY